MKKILILATAVLGMSAMSCSNNGVSGQKREFKSITDSTVYTVDEASYAFGVNVGFAVKQWKKDVENFNMDAFFNGIKACVDGNDTMTQQQDVTILNKFMGDIQKKKAEKNKIEGQAYLDKNAKVEGVVTTESGLQYKIIKEGKGNYPKETDQVEVNYVGKLTNGEEFDSSYKRNESAKFPLNMVIPGWREGIQKVREGGKIQLVVPYSLAYGEQGNQGIPPCSTLIFDVELIKIITPEAQQAAPARPIIKAQPQTQQVQ